MGLTDMLSGFLGGGSGKKPPLKVKHEELLAYAEKELEGPRQEALKTAAGKLSEIKYALSQLEKALDALEKAPVEGANERVQRISKTSRADTVRRLRALVKKLAPPTQAGLEALHRYAKEAHATLRQEVLSYGKTIFYTGLSAKEQMQQVGSYVKALEDELEALNTYFSENKRLLGLSLLEQCVEELEEAESGLAQARASFQSASQDLEALHLKRDQAQKAYDDLATCKEAQALETLRKQLERLQVEREELRARVVNLVAPVEKLLRRLSALSGRNEVELGSAEDKLLSRYIDDPYAAAKADPKGEGLHALLSRLRPLLEDGRISVKPREKEKKERAVEELLKVDFFSEVFWRENELERNIQSIEKKLRADTFSKKLDNQKKALDALHARIKEGVEKKKHWHNAVHGQEQASEGAAKKMAKEGERLLSRKVILLHTPSDADDAVTEF